jgi:hypothetical protein
MDVLVVIIALFLVGIGQLVKKYPDTISGYSTMSKDKRKNVDIQSVGNLLNKGFLLIAAAMLVLYFIFRLSGMQVAAFIGFTAPIFIGTPVLLAMAQKYDKNVRGKFAKYLPAGIIVLLAVAIGAWTTMDARPTKVTIEGETMKFTGTYGIELPLDEIAKYELWDNIPRITARTNGFGLGNICKGHFTLEGLGQCRLFIRHGDSPYLYIETTGGRKIIFNSPDPDCVKNLFEKLQ